MSLPLREAAIGSLIDGLYNHADDLSIQNYTLDCQMEWDGNLEIAISFGQVADIGLFKIRVS
jgi:hypothetical protein